MKIAIAGTGYVGLSNAIFLVQHNEVDALDIIGEKVDMLNRKQSPIEVAEIEDYPTHKKLNLRATMVKVDAYTGATHGLVMKAGLDNFPIKSPRPLVGEGWGRGSIMKRIKAKSIEEIVYEPALKEQTIYHSRVVNDLAQFKKEADVIVANRITDDISDVASMMYSRDLFGKD